jgi:hypothetical protein
MVDQLYNFFEPVGIYKKILLLHIFLAQRTGVAQPACWQG